MTTATSVALKSVVLSQNQTPILPNEPHMPNDSPSQTYSSVPTVTSNTVNKISAEIDKNIADAKNMHKKIKALETHQQFFEMRNYIFGRTTTEQRAYIKDKTKVKLGTLKSLNIKNMQELKKIFDSPYLESVITKNIMEKATKKAESLAKEQARLIVSI